MNKSIIAHPACMNTPRGILQKAIIDLADRCDEILIIGLAKKEEEMDHFIRFTKLNKAQISLFAAILNSYVLTEVVGARFSDMDKETS